MSSEPLSAVQEHVIGSFVSLLSSALTVNGEGGLELIGDSASTMREFFSNSVMEDSVCLLVPILRIKAHDTKSWSMTEGDRSSVEEVAKKNLAQPVELTRRELENAPVIMLMNLTDSFMALVDSRLKSTVAALLMRMSQNQEADPTLTRVLVGLLSASAKPISLAAIVTSFQVLPPSHRTSEGDIVLPMVMETGVDLKVLGDLFTVKMMTPGTIQASLDVGPSNCMITKTEVALDMNDFLASMKKQVRSVVRKAVETSTRMASTLLRPSSDFSLSSLGSRADLQLPTKSVDFASQDETTSSSLMPPPPRRASQNSVGSASSLRAQHQDISGNNATWPTPRNANSSSQKGAGLSLLSAAAVEGEGASGAGTQRSADSPPPEKTPV